MRQRYTKCRVIQTTIMVLLLGINAHAGDLNFRKGFEEPLLILMAEPPVVHNAFGVNATAHVSGLFKSPFSVRLIGPGAVEVMPPFSYDSSHRGLLQLEIPPGLDAGTWDLVVEQTDQGEMTSLAAAFTMVDALTVTFNLQPAVLSTATGGEFRLDSDGDDFAAVPQVLLRLDTAPATTPATSLQGVKYIREDRIFAPVPAGLDVGTYDVIAINPDGSTGFVNQGLVISGADAPVISAVTPEVLPASSGTFEVEGSGFDPALILAMNCESGGAVTVVPTFNTSTSLSVTYSDAFDEELCVLELLNPDGQETAFAALHRAPASLSLSAPVAQANMLVARRAPGLAMHRVDGEGFSLYAMGGDDGATANAFDSVEIAEVGEFGEVDGWVISRQTLPAGRTFSWATSFGDYLYLVGGNNGTEAVNSVLRAQILDAASAPDAIRHTFLLNPGAPGFVGGQQAYRISAVFPGSDTDNPNGESLAGHSRIVFAPVSADLDLLLEWDPVPGAASYNIYTNPQGMPFDGDGDSLELIANTPSTAWVHNGQATMPATIPLLPGETGTWHQVSSWTLGTPRSHLAGVIAPLKGTPDSMVLYTMGGVDEMGDTLQSYEYSVISSATSATPGYGGFTSGTDSLLTPLRNLAAWAVNYAGTDDSWIFVGTGFDEFDDPQQDIERGTVSVNGDLGTLISAGSNPDDRAGASGFVTGGGLAIAGGDDGLASTNTRNTTLNDSGSGPEMPPWNVAPPGLTDARIYPGTAQESVFIFISGGADAMGNPISSVERFER